MRSWSFFFLQIVTTLLLFQNVLGAELGKTFSHNGNQFRWLERPARGTSSTSFWGNDSSFSSRANPVGWRPKGENPGVQSPACQAERLGELILAPGGQLERVSRIRNWRRTCEGQLYQPNRLQGTLLRLARLDSDFLSDSKIKKIEVKFKDERRLRGLLGLKSGPEKRPLVLARCGLFCNGADGSATKMTFLKLFEESPFHVLLLANLSGSQWATLNGTLGLGGFEEGRQAIEVSDLIRSQNSPLGGLISSVHLLGWSLGAHGALYGGLYDSLNPQKSGEPRFQSALAICPVVNLENSVRTIYEPGLLGTLMSLGSMSYISEVKDFVPVLGDYLEVLFNDGSLKGDEIFRAFSLGAFQFYQEQLSKKKFPYHPFKNLKLDKIEDFWRAQNYINHSSDNQIPTLLVPSKDDNIVYYERNAQLFEQQADPTSLVQSIAFERGDHCGLSAALGWETETQLLRSYILANSPEYKTRYREISFSKLMDESPWPHRFRLRRGEVLTDSYFRVSRDGQTLSIHFGAYSAYRDLLDAPCSEVPYWWSPFQACHRRFKVEVSTRALGLRVPWFKDISSWDRYSRQLNTQVQLRTSSGHPIHGRAEPPSIMVISQFD